MEQLTLDLGNQDIWCGRTSPVHSLRERQAEKTSESSSKKSVKSQTKKFLFLDLRGGDGATQEPSWETDFRLHGELWTLNFGECPNAAVESHLSQILEATPHPKYYLSAKGCDGVINRADRHGKTNFPEVLREALEEQSEYLKSHPNAINEATEWYESHPNAINDKVCTIVSGIHKETGNTQDNALCYETKMWDGKDVAPTLTKNNAGGGQRMPDKDNFNCVVEGGVRRIQCVDDRRQSLDARSELRNVNGTERSRGSDVYASARCESLRNRVHGRQEQHAESGTANCGDGSKRSRCGDNECFKRQNGNSPSADKRTSTDNDRLGPTVALNILQDPIHSNGVCPCLSKGSANGECVIRIVERFTQPIALDRAAYNQGKNANYDIGVDESGTAFTVVAKGPGLVKE